MPVGQLTPEVAHNRSKNPIDSSLRGQQPATDPSELHNGSLLDTWGIMSPEILWSTEETAGSEKKKNSTKSDVFFLVHYFKNPWRVHDGQLIAQKSVSKEKAVI